MHSSATVALEEAAAAREEAAAAREKAETATAAALSVLKKDNEKRCQQVADLKASNTRLNTQLQHETEKAEKAEEVAKSQRNFATFPLKYMWIVQANTIIAENDPSECVTIQTYISPHTVMNNSIPTIVFPFENVDGEDKLVKAIKELGNDGKEGQGKFESATGIDKPFAKGQPRAIIGCSETWKHLGFFVPVDEDAEELEWTGNSQAVICVDENGAHFLLDLDSKNGAYVILPRSGKGVWLVPELGETGRVELEDGTIVLLGDTVLVIRLPGTKKQKTKTASKQFD